MKAPAKALAENWSFVIDGPSSIAITNFQFSISNALPSVTGDKSGNHPTHASGRAVPCGSHHGWIEEVLTQRAQAATAPGNT
jgi:hypothetical protein